MLRPEAKPRTFRPARPPISRPPRHPHRSLPFGADGPLGRAGAGWRDGARRTGAVARHNAMLLLREPGPLASRMVLPLAFLLLLHPLYQAAQGRRDGIAQAVIATLITFSLLALSIAGGAILMERTGHTWDRIRATPVRPAELLTGKALPVLAALLAQQALVTGFGVVVLGLHVASVPLLAVALLAWTAALLTLGAAAGLLARSFSELSAAYDIGGMLLSSLGGALVPLAAMPGWIQHAAPASPGYWAVSALRDAMSGSAGGTLRAAAVLLVFALGFALAAALRARRGWERQDRI
jgi:ABC-2 type transport system permease protein